MSHNAMTEVQFYIQSLVIYGPCLELLPKHLDLVMQSQADNDLEKGKKEAFQSFSS